MIWARLTQREGVDVHATLFQPFDALHRIAEAMPLGSFRQRLAEHLNNLVESLGGELSVAATTLAFGYLCPEAQDLGFGNLADLHLTEPGQQVVIDRGANRLRMGTPPPRQRFDVPILGGLAN